MKTSDKYKYWAMLSDYDIETAKVLISGKRWVYVAYICQQAIERQLKGMYVYHSNKEAPKSHNLGYLFARICETAEFDNSTDEEFNARRLECEDFLSEIMFYYMSDYPFSYKKITDRFIDGRTASEIFDKTRFYLAWLRSLQPMCERITPEELIEEERQQQ